MHKTGDCPRCEEDLWTPRWRLAAASGAADGDENNWLVSFSDMLSLLLVFFIMFFILTKKPGGADEPAEPPAEETARSIPEPSRSYPPSDNTTGASDVAAGFTGLAPGGDLSVSSTDREIIITVGEKITFRPGEAELLPGFVPVLNHITTILEEHPLMRAEIIGHTDNVPIQTARYPSNWELSVARATSVLAYFIRERSLDPYRFSVSGYGDQRPTASNSTPEDRARNRRVEIRLIRAGNQ